MLDLKELIQCPFIEYDNDYNVVYQNDSFVNEFKRITNLKEIFPNRILNNLINTSKSYDVYNNNIYCFISKRNKNNYICSICKDLKYDLEEILFKEVEVTNSFKFIVKNNDLYISNIKNVKRFDKFIKHFVYKKDINLLEKALNNLINPNYIEIRIKNFDRINDVNKYLWYRIYYKNINNILTGIALNIDSYKQEEFKYENMNNILRYVRSNNLFSYKINYTTDECFKIKSMGNLTYLKEHDKASNLYKLIFDNVISGDNVDKLILENVIKEYYLGNHNHKVICKVNVNNDKYIWLEIEITLTKNPKTNHLEGLFIACDINNETEFKNTINNVLESNYEFIGSLNVHSPYITFFDSDVANRNLLLRRCKYNQMVNEYLKSCVSLDNINKYLKCLSYGSIIKKLMLKQTYIVTLNTKINGETFYKRWTFYKNKLKDEIILYSTDVTKIVSEEIEKQNKLKEAVETANKAVEAKRKFLSQISHDIRTPMNGIMGLITMSLDEDINDKARENLKTAYESGKYMLELINDTLDMHTIEDNRININYEVFNLKETIENIISTISFSASNKKIKINENIIESNLNVSFDKSKLSQILVNILSNAIKYTNEYGIINLNVQSKVIKNKLHTHFVIEDNGIGIESSFLPNIFSAYSRERRNDANGTGLGMYIVKNLIDALKGKIKINSEIGKGTKVQIELIMDLTKEEINFENQNFDFSNVKVLLVDDDLINIKVGKYFLERKGFIVESATSGEEAIKKVTNNFYNLILMDIRMPIMDGYETTKRIRNINSLIDIPIIAMSANAFEEDVKKALESGMNDHISKPIIANNMYSVIAKHIKNK